MQTKKRISGKNSSRERASSRVTRAQKKVSENAQVAEKKVVDLITSSVRKQKSAGTLLKKNEDPVNGTNLDTRYTSLLEEDTSITSLGSDAVNNTSLDSKGSNTGTNGQMLGTLFSPSFHVSKSVEEEIDNEVKFSRYFHCGDQKSDCHSEVDTKIYSDSCCMEMDLNQSTRNSDLQTCGGQMPLSDSNTLSSSNDVGFGATLPSEVSAIYLAMRNSKLECVEEHGQDSMSTHDCAEEDDSEEFDDFDPYLFIKNLPELSAVVPSFRPMLLPKQTRSCPPISLVLDLDETLVHSSLEPCDDVDFTFSVKFNLTEHQVYVKTRPHLQEFMEKVASLFEIIIFTASQSIYAEQLLNVLDPKRRIFRHRVFRDSCVFVEGNFLKDLTILGRDLARVAIIDNSPQAFGFQVDNGIPIESWFDDRSDQELLLLLPFLESLVGVEDVRPLIAKKFNLRRRVDSAFYPTTGSVYFD